MEKLEGRFVACRWRRGKRVREIIEWLHDRKPCVTNYPRYTQFSDQVRSLIKFIERKSLSFKSDPPEVY